MQTAAHQGAYLIRHYDRWLAHLDDRHLAHEPVPGAKTAGWILGHLVITGDFGRRLCGLSPITPKEWRAVFAPGTLPSHDPAVYPPMAELLAAFRAVYADLAAHAAETAADVLAAPNPYEPTRGSFPTAGSFVAYLLSGHLAYHLGQLSVWRAATVPSDPSLGAA